MDSLALSDGLSGFLTYRTSTEEPSLDDDEDDDDPDAESLFDDEDGVDESSSFTTFLNVFRWTER